MPNRIRNLALVALIASAACTIASTAVAQARWTSHVSASWVREIVHRDGSLYLATAGGLVVYDIAGDSFTQYTNVSGLPSNNLTCLDFRADGSLYVGTGDIGIARVRVADGNLSVLRRFNQQIDGLADNAVNSLAVWNGDLVYGSNGGAGTVVNDFPAALYRTFEGMPANVVNDVLPIGNVAWMATDSGTVVLDDLGLLRIPSGGPETTNAIGSDGTLVYVGTDSGVWTLDPSDSTWSQIGPGGSSNRVYSFFYDGQTMRAGSSLYMWTYNGGTNWSATSLLPVYSKYGLAAAAAAVKGLVVVPGGDIYMGTGNTDRRRGLNLIRYDGVDLVDLAPNTPNSSDIRRLSVDVDGSVWGSFWTLGIGKLDPDGQWFEYNKTIPAGDSLSNLFNTVCLADPDGFKWFHTLSTSVGNPQRLDRLDDKVDNDYGNDEWERVTLGSGGGDGLGSARMQNAVVDPAGNRWFLSDADLSSAGWEGIDILSRDQSQWLQIKTGTPGASLAAPNVVDVAFTSDCAYVAQLEFGVQCWLHRGYDWTSLSTLGGDAWTVLWPRDDPDIKVSSVAATSDGKVWIGTNDGLYRVNTGDFSENRVKRFGLFSGFGAGLTSIAVTDLLVDHDGDIWVATTGGLNRVSRDDENVIDAWSTSAEYQRSLSQAQFPFDVISPLVNERCQALALHPEEPILYIATAEGMSVFNYPEPPPAPLPLSKAYVYPNPVYGRLGHDDLFIGNATEAVVVEVYNAEGELVHSTPSGETLSDGDRIWDLTDRGGFLVASGVYFVRIISAASGNAVVKPVSVIR